METFGNDTVSKTKPSKRRYQLKDKSFTHKPVSSPPDLVPCDQKSRRNTHKKKNTSLAYSEQDELILIDFNSRGKNYS